MKTLIYALSLALACLPLSSFSQEPAPKRLQVLLIDGQNNHDWQRTTEQLVEALNAAKLFEITVSTSPTKENWDSWTIDFTKFDVVLNNYYGDPWPQAISDSLLKFLADGGGMVNVHAANNAFPNWPEFNQITGLLWRDPMGGDRLYFDDADKLVREPRGHRLALIVRPDPALT